MIRFAALVAELDRTTRTSGKVDAMTLYFTDAPASDAAWAVFFLTGGRIRRALPVRRLAGWAMERAGVDEWLFDASYETVGDLAETIALLLPEAERSGDMPLHRWVEDRLLPLVGADDGAQRRIVLDAWNELDGWQRFVWNKLITGGFRIGVSKALVVRALAAASGVDEPTIAHRLSGGWEPGAREHSAEGLMLKRLDAEYGTGRRRGPWWKWKTEPFTVDAVMMYAQAGHGRRAALHTDYTFGVWDVADGEPQLVPFAKAYTGLTDAEIRKLDHWIRRNTLEKFGPVRHVPPQHVFEIAFEGIQPSPRHRSGIAVRFPRILRWRHDRAAEDADTLEMLRGLLEPRP